MTDFSRQLREQERSPESVTATPSLPENTGTSQGERAEKGDRQPPPHWVPASPGGRALSVFLSPRKRGCIFSLFLYNSQLGLKYGEGVRKIT